MKWKLKKEVKTGSLRVQGRANLTYPTIFNFIIMSGFPFHKGVTVVILLTFEKLASNFLFSIWIEKKHGYKHIKKSIWFFRHPCPTSIPAAELLAEKEKSLDSFQVRDTFHLFDKKFCFFRWDGPRLVKKIWHTSGRKSLCRPLRCTSNFYDQKATSKIFFNYLEASFCQVCEDR